MDLDPLSVTVTLNGTPEITLDADRTVFQCTTGIVCVGYTVSDPDTATATATVMVTVTPVNDPPPPFLLLSPGPNTRIEITPENLGDSLFFFWEGVPDVDGDILTYYLEATSGLATVLAAAATTTVGLSRPYEELAAGPGRPGANRRLR